MCLPAWRSGPRICLHALLLALQLLLLHRSHIHLHAGGCQPSSSGGCAGGRQAASARRLLPVHPA